MDRTDRSKEDSEQFTPPVIKDYGDLAEITATGRTGGRADGSFKIGDIVTFLSS